MSRASIIPAQKTLQFKEPIIHGGAALAAHLSRRIALLWILIHFLEFYMGMFFFFCFHYRGNLKPRWLIRQSSSLMYTGQP